MEIKMLEIIVLGQVPGTSVQFSFLGVILLAASLAVLARMLGSYFRYHRFVTRVGPLAHYLVLKNKKTKRASSRA